MNVSINLSLNYEEAYRLAKYLPESNWGNDEDEEELSKLKEKLCEILCVEPHDI